MKEQTTADKLRDAIIKLIIDEDLLKDAVKKAKKRNKKND